MNRRHLIYLAGSFIFCLLVSCATSRPAPNHEKNIQFSIRKAEGFYLSKVGATVDNNGLFIYGKVERAHLLSFRRFFGHIDVEISGLDGKVIQRLTAPIEHRKLIRRFYTTQFKVHAFLVPQSGIIVSLTPHNQMGACTAK